MASTRLKKEPTDAASVGVARPNRMTPSTDIMRTASGTKEVRSMYKTSRMGMSVSSLDGLGARLGFRAARPIT